MPSVSIVIPIYNTEKYLEKCLNSLLNQALVDIEIICINDASTDNSLNIIYKYAEQDSRIRVINLVKNKRQGGARNEGLKIATGEYIGFVDSDDWVDEKMFQCLYAEAIKQNADICVCDYYKVYNGCEVEKEEILKDDIFYLSEVDKKKKIILAGGYICCCLIKRDLILNNNLFFPENVLYEDNAIGGAIFLAARNIIKVSEPFYYYRQDNVSTTRSMNNWNYFDRLKTALMFLENMTRIDVNRIYQEEIEFRFYELYHINTVFGCINLFSPPAIKEIVVICDSVKKYVDIKSNKYYKQLPISLRGFFWLLRTNARIGVSLFLLMKKCVRFFR